MEDLEVYKKIIQTLENRGIQFEDGLTNKEVIDIEKRYGVIFPDELKSFFSIALPVAGGFYNWRDITDSNVNIIKRRFKIPFVELVEDIDEIYWSDDWENEPDNKEERNTILLNKINSAPKLIPIYSHRYIASVKSSQNPVFSVYGTDIIYYGESLGSYLEIEFGLKKHSDMKTEIIVPVPFWSELL